MIARKLAALAGGAVLVVASLVQAQIPQYGSNITLDQARKAATAAEAEARRNGWPVAIAIVDTAGQLVFFQRIDNTQSASMDIAIDKAVSAARFRRPTKVFEDGLVTGGNNLRFLNMRHTSLADGGLPIPVDGKIVGGIGVSGVLGSQDAIVAKAGADALK